MLPASPASSPSMTPSRFLLAAILALGLLPAARAADPPSPEAAASAVMPPLTRRWTPEDYVVAAGMIVDHQVPMPTYETPQGRALLDKLTSSDNYAIFTDESISVRTRLQRGSQMFGGLGQLMIFYGSFLESSGKQLHAEGAALIDSVLRMSALESDLARQLFDKMDPADPRAIAAHAKFGEGLEAIVNGVLQAFDTKGFFLPAESTLELRTLSSTLGSIDFFLAPDVRASLSAKFVAMRKKAASPEDRELLDRLVGILKA